MMTSYVQESVKLVFLRCNANYDFFIADLLYVTYR